jgi:dethiobiotin synthetase
MNKYFITGIGTNVGKTLVSAILCEALQADYWKPIQCGIEDGRDVDTVKGLLSNSKSVCYDEIYLLKEPASPHLAAKKEGITIDFNKLNLPVTSNTLFVEGAGGPLVPLNDRNFVIDIAKHNNIPVILVISSYLGCINHSLLAIDYLISHNYRLKGLILNGDFDTEVKAPIIAYKNIPVLAEIPYSKKGYKAFVSQQASELNVYQFL